MGSGFKMEEKERGNDLDHREHCPVQWLKEDGTEGFKLAIQ